MRAIGLAVLAVAVSSCAIPGRDNPHDPVNAPIARLTLVDATTNVTGDLVAPWAHAIAFDATASTDRQDDIESCVFAVHTTSGNPVGEPWETDCFGELHGSPFGEPGALSLSTSYHVQVRVIDARGNFSDAPPPGIENRRKFKLTNAEPVADPGIDRVLPREGFPWNPAQPITLTFDGSGSEDEDGDAVSYCWTLNIEGVPGTESPCTGEPTVSVSVTPSDYDGNSLTAQLRVRDPLGAYSRSRTARVSFQSLNIWIMPVGTGALERVDSVHRTGIWGGSNAAITATELPASGQVVIIGDVELDLVDGDTRDNTMHVVVPPLPPKSASPAAVGIDLGGTGLARLASDPRPLERRVWLRTSHAPFATPTFSVMELGNCSGVCSYLSSYIVDASGGVTAERLADIPLAFSENGDRDGGRLFVDGMGRVFAANGFGSQVVVLDLDGTVTADLLPGAGQGVIASAIAPRPGTTETWIMLSHGLDSSSSQSAELHIFEGSTPLRTANIADETIPFGVAWIDTNEFWLGRPGLGLSRVNAETVSTQAFTGTVRIEEATVQLVHEVSDVGFMVADRISGDVWFSGLSGNLLRVSPAGEITDYDIGSSSTLPSFVDSIGALWHSPRGTLSQAFAPSIDGVAVDMGIRPANMVEYDWQTGGVWFPVAVPPGLLHAAEDGTVLSYERDVVIGGVEQFLPLTQLFRLTPGTPTGWYVGINPLGGSPAPGPLYRIEDVSAKPLQLTEVLTPADAAEIVDNGSIFEPFAPVPSSPSNIWTVMNDGIVQLDVNGVQASLPIALAPLEVGQPIRAARALETNDLCLATMTSADVIHLRRIEPDGDVIEHATFIASGSNNDDSLAAVAATVDPDGPICWVAWSAFTPGESAHIRAFRPSGNQFAAYDTDAAALPFGEQAMSILPLPAGEVWATFARLVDLSGDFDRPVWKSVLVRSTSGTLSEVLSLEPTSGAHLVAPWTRAEQRGAFN